MIFNELYSAYYNTVAKIISAVLRGDVTQSQLQNIVNENAFGESMLTILPNLKSEKWQLVREDFFTPITNIPTMPLTLIQKQWLKAVLLDPRAKLFGIEIDDLEDVEPLFTPDDYVVYDKYSDGDPFEDAEYIKNFRIILSAIKSGDALKIHMQTRKGRSKRITLLPQKLEYSEKDDKFRLIAMGDRHLETINLGRIISVEQVANHNEFKGEGVTLKTEKVTLKVTDDRNALERAMLHFAHFEKQAERIDDSRYLLHIIYNKEDETELVIRVLSFGLLIEVLEPSTFRNLIIERLKTQIELLN